MQAQVDELVEHTATRFASHPPNKRLLIAIVGIPGSGKTTLASHVVSGLNSRLGAPVAAMIPMDGYHLTRAQLSAMPDPERAHFCRGAHWTFSPQALAALLRACKAPLPPSPSPLSSSNPTSTNPTSTSSSSSSSSSTDGAPPTSSTPTTVGTLYAASFDHALKDPVENDIPIEPSHRILVFEGNYLALSAPPEWTAVSAAFDERWYVRVDEAVAKRRLARRHFEARITASLDEGMDRAERNDMVNGRFLVENMVAVDRVVDSILDERYAAET